MMPLVVFLTLVLASIHVNSYCWMSKEVAQWAIDDFQAHETNRFEYFPLTSRNTNLLQFEFSGVKFGFEEQIDDPQHHLLLEMDFEIIVSIFVMTGTNVV